jgi:hypothetical protein
MPANFAGVVFFLRRQSELYGLSFQVGEIGFGVSAEAALERTGVASLVEAPANRSPARVIDARQIACGRRSQPGRGAGNQAHRAAHHGPRRGGLAPGGPPLVIAARAEELLKAIVGARQIGHFIAVEQPGPVALRHFAEVVDRDGERSGFGAVANHGAKQPVKAAADEVCGFAFGIAEHVGDRVHPAVGALDGGPEGGGVLEAAADQLAQPGEPRRGAPFFVTRSRLSAIRSSRLFSFSPEAASGARPSSVIAERTAAQ